MTETSDREPQTDVDGAPFWAGLARREIVVQECDGCSAPRFPPMPSCPECGATGSGAKVLTGAGTVYSKVQVNRAFTPERAQDVPYTIATVDLDGGVRMFGRVDVEARIGDPVRASFHDHDGWTELRFEVVR